MAKIAQKYNNEKRIVLFKNEKFESGSDKPLYWGYTWVNGVQYRVALWGKVDSTGKPYFQGTLQDQTAEKQQPEMEFEDQTAATAKKSDENTDDEII